MGMALWIPHLLIFNQSRAAVIYPTLAVFCTLKLFFLWLIVNRLLLEKNCLKQPIPVYKKNYKNFYVPNVFV